MGVGVDSLAEQGFEVQLKAAYRRVEGVQLSAFLPGAPHPVRAVGPRLGLKVAVEVVAALQIAQATGQGMVEGFRYHTDSAMQRRTGLALHPALRGFFQSQR